MIIDGFAHQLPDIDPGETEEWLDSFSAVVQQRGTVRAQYLMARLERAGPPPRGGNAGKCLHALCQHDPRRERALVSR